MDEKARRERLVLALSDAVIADITILMHNARLKLEARVSGCNEREVSQLRQEIEYLAELLDDFWSTRTEV